mmetsp:Transcript_25924/g.56296  ORF Transcript_25924/g.56296 Transcript_25924/m.56296 type:complete len:252 (-) Transcript_25924:102-857(-)
MLLSPDLSLPMGPPPQAVLDKRWLWQLLIFLLAVTFGLRLIGLDIPGALLSGLMLCFAVVMSRDGMQEMPKYALVYAVLSGLNFFFDILPLITELGGRVSRTTEPGQSTTAGGIRQTSYTMTTKITPFFDYEEGLIYNVQSSAMLMSPVCMALGVYLSITAHNEIQRHSPFWDNGDMETALGFASMPLGPGTRGGATATTNGSNGVQPPGDGTRNRGAPGSAPSRGPTGGDGASGRETFERFMGQSHKLGD